MEKLLEYMRTAYMRVEREARDALRAKSYSEEVTNACKECYGDNFNMSKDSDRLGALLPSLRETKVHSVYFLVLSKHHVDEIRERGKQALSERITSTGDQTTDLLNEAESRTEQQTALIPTQGKNYKQNRRKAEKKKQKRASAAKSNQVEVSNDSQDSLKEIVDKSIISIESYDGPSVVYENVTHISKDSTVTEHVDIAQNATSTEGINESGENSAVIASNAAFSERINQTILEDDIVVSPTAVEQSNEIGCLSPGDFSQGTDPASKSVVVSDSAKNVTARVSGLASYHHEELLEYAVEIEDGRNWTQVMGTRKNSKNVDTNSNDNNSSLVTEDLRFARHANKPQGVVKFGMPRELAPSPIRRAQITGLWKKKQILSTAISYSTNSKSSGLARSLSASTVLNTSAPKTKASTLDVPKPTVAEKTDIVSVVIGQKLDPLQTTRRAPVATVQGQELKTFHTLSSVSTAVKLVAVHPDSETTSEILHNPARVPIVAEQVVSRPGSGLDSEASPIDDYLLPNTSSGVTKKEISRSGAASAKAKVDVQPSIPEVLTVSTAALTLDTHCNRTISGNSTYLATVAAVASTPTIKSHGDTRNSDLASSFTITDPTTTAASIADLCRDTKKFLRFSPSESIDPGPVPYYQHLQPYKEKGRRTMSETMEAELASEVTSLSDAGSLVESLRDAGVEDNALSSLIARPLDLATSSTHYLALPNAASARLRGFACKHLDVRRANSSPRSAGNSPIPPLPARGPIYHYPPPDVLTPENQDILDRITKGPPYPKYPRVPVAGDQPKIQPLAAAFMTKKPSVVTYDGKDAYEVLGDRCPAPLTIKDHPNVNKCVQQGETFHCSYCRVEISGNVELEKGIICPGCGPCSETRYCQRSHLLADSIKHFEVCGKKPRTYPIMWSELPLDYQSLYPYIKPLTGTITAQGFRQMAHCLVINSNGIIENPYKAHFELHMSMEHRVKCYDWVQEMYQFQDKGSYYLFHPNEVAGGVDIELTITLPDGSDGNFREDQRFARVRNAAFLTNHPTLLCVIYRRIKDIIRIGSPDDVRYGKRIYFFNLQFKEEFPSLDLATVAPLDENYCFENDWQHVRRRVHDLELGNPILRAWITEDAEDDGIPADPTARFQGKHWALVLDGPTFRAGSADRKDWGPGWFGGNEKKWQKQLDRKYLKMINDELAKVEIELEGEII